MSAQALQHMIMRGALDKDFIAQMTRSPHEILAQFDLTGPEQSFILDLHPRSLKELAAGVEAWRRGELPAHRPAPTHALMTALAG